MARSAVLVFVQFACIGFFLFTGPWYASGVLGITIEVIGLVLGIWAIAAMRLQHLSVFPDPKPDSVLVERGPYAQIRHPMYTAVLLVCGALAFDRMNEASIAVYFVLLFNQLMKLRYEEKLLLKKYKEEYFEYMRRTSALLPKIF